MRRHEPSAEKTARELDRIGAQKRELTRKEISILRRQLAEARREVERLEHELRSRGNAEARRDAGRIDWNALFERLGTTFTAREMAELTGARPRHVAVITHRWRQEKRIVETGRGRFRKLGERRPS